MDVIVQNRCKPILAQRHKDTKDSHFLTSASICVICGSLRDFRVLLSITVLNFQTTFWTSINLILDTRVQNRSGVALSLCERYSEPTSGTDGTATKPFWTIWTYVLHSVFITFLACLAFLAFHSRNYGLPHFGQSGHPCAEPF